MGSEADPPERLTSQRLAEIKLFHQTLVRRLDIDASALTGFERAMVTGIMGELIAHVESTP